MKGEEGGEEGRSKSNTTLPLHDIRLTPQAVELKSAL